MDNKEAPCGNPDCNELGKMKCSGCSSVTYCSQACQKKHWPAHKATCKSSKDSPKAAVAAPAQQVVAANQEDVRTKLEALKGETQKSFQTGQFPQSIVTGLQAMELARQLPQIEASGEIIQLHLNLASAYMHTQNKEEAISHSDLAVREAEAAVNMRERAGNPQAIPQAIEVVTIALGSRAFTFLNIGASIEVAFDSAQKSLALSEKIYPKNDPRLHKSLRALALVCEKMGNAADAEKHFVRAYTILCLATGAHSRESQLLLDDLMGMFVRKNDFVSAERYCMKNYLSLKDKTEDREVLILADSAARLASIVRRLDRIAEAETLLEQALSIREKHIALIGPMGVAFTLIQLAQVMEAQGKYTDLLEQRLMLALDIFGRVQGQGSPEVMNTLQSLRNVRIRRKEREQAAGGGSAQVEELDDDGVVVSGENKSTGGRPAMPSSSSSSRLAGGLDGASHEELMKKMKFEDNDAVGRMMQANRFFETQRFSYAERLIAEAYVIFLRQNGPDHPSTQAAKQNLAVVRQNGLNQLWMQVVTEEVLSLDEATKQTATSAQQDGNASDATTTAAKKGASSSHSSDESKQIDDYSRLMSQPKSTSRPEDQWLSGTPSQSGGCIVC